MRRFLEQYGRSDFLILKAQKLSDAKLEEYAKEAAAFELVQKFVFSANVSAHQLETHVYPRIAANISTIEMLDLSNNMLRGSLSAQCPSCKDAMQRFSFLSEWLRHAEAEHPAVCAIHALIDVLKLPENTYLGVLKLRGNPLGNAGALLLLLAIVDNPSSKVSVLDLSRCAVDSDCAAALNSLLKRVPASKKFFLKMNGNNIGADGTIQLAQGLPAHISLTLSKNRPMPQKRTQQVSKSKS